VRAQLDLPQVRCGQAPHDNFLVVEPAEPSKPRHAPPVRWALLLLALLSLLVGIVGIFVPLLPTVPFVLLAAWAAARSSPRLERALHEHPRFGPQIRDWERSGVVRRPAKRAATVAMTVSAAIVWLVAPPLGAALATAFMAAVLLWLWRRPEAAA
jgi:uncharacterized membrane protein YbaN (DUF454 family)